MAKIAGGGMSAVYLGRRVEPNAQAPNVVALKIVKRDASHDPRFVQMFLEEGRLLARLVHPNIVRTLEVGSDPEQDFIAMELMLGKTFAAIHDALATRKVRLNPDIAAWAVARVADALHYAHELTDDYGRPLALVHRDVNPANVFATFDGEVKLFDFGLAKATAHENAGSKIVAGKLSYLSPEQIMQMPLDRRSDVFSLGTTLWELLTSKRLFRRDTDVETVRAVQLGPIPDIRTVGADLPEELARIVRAALERNRDHRYPKVSQMARDLDAFVASRSSAANVVARLGKLVETLFPDERKRQTGWLKQPVTPGGSRTMSAVVPPSMPPVPPTLEYGAEDTDKILEAPPPSMTERNSRRGQAISDAPPTSRDGKPSVRPPPITARGGSLPPTVPRAPSVSPPPTPSQRPPPTPSQRPPAGASVPPRPTPGAGPLPGFKPGGLRSKPPIALPSRASVAPPRPTPTRPPPPVAPKPPEPEFLESDTTEIEAVPTPRADGRGND